MCWSLEIVCRKSKLRHLLVSFLLFLFLGITTLGCICAISENYFLTYFVQLSTLLRKKVISGPLALFWPESEVPISLISVSITMSEIEYPSWCMRKGFVFLSLWMSLYSSSIFSVLLVLSLFSVKWLNAKILLFWFFIVPKIVFLIHSYFHSSS